MDFAYEMRLLICAYGDVGPSEGNGTKRAGREGVTDSRRVPVASE
jgi:hypothetical protein